VVAVRLIGSLLVTLVLAGMALGLVGRFAQQRRVDSSPVPGVTSVVTVAQVGDVRVRVGEAGRPVVVRSTLTWSFREPDLQLRTNGGVLTVDTGCPKQWLLTDCSVDLDLTVPPGTALELATEVGDITGTGAGGPLTAVTRTGDISLTATGSATVQAFTSTGDVRVNGAAAGADLEMTTSTGDVTVALDTVPTRVQARSSTGDLRITVPGGQSYQVDALTDTGDRSVQVPTDPASTHRISARASTGDVRILAG
jgi:hypothetical protein